MFENIYLLWFQNAKQLPLQPHEEKGKLRSSFPVSSGTHHRKEEPNEWTPVPPKEEKKKVFQEPEEDFDDLEVSGCTSAMC